jgi:hypothetical protein
LDHSAQKLLINQELLVFTAKHVKIKVKNSQGGILMSTLQELITDIDERLPNTFTPARKIGWMQDKLNEIWPHIAFTDSYEFDTIGGQQVYVLPYYIKIQYIEGVFVSSVTEEHITASTNWYEHRYQRPNESVSGRTFYDVLGSLGISPAPDANGYKVSVIIRKKPLELDANDLDAAFDFDDELSHMLKYEVMRIIAESPPYESAARAQYFNSKMNEVFDLILERELRYKVKMGNKARPNSWWRRH